MSRRYETVGIKQAVRFEWMQKTANLFLSGLNSKVIRQELHDYLADRMGSGERKDRSAEARSFAVSILMITWVECSVELRPLRDDLSVFVANRGNQEFAAHWAMLSAAYPFWFNVARQTGRILSLQDQVTMKQISTRTIEQYGDRQTVSRNVQFVVRSFAFWGVIIDSENLGSYEKARFIELNDAKMTSLLFEAALLTVPEGKAVLGNLLNNPAFFPFRLAMINGELACQFNKRLQVSRYGLDDELLKLEV